MELFDQLRVKFLVLVALIIVCLYSVFVQHDVNSLQDVYQRINNQKLGSLLKRILSKTNNWGTVSIMNTTATMALKVKSSSTTMIITSTATSTTTSTTTTTTTTDSTTVQLTTTTGMQTTIDPAELLMERPDIPTQVSPKTSNGSIVAFIFHTRFHILAGLQIYMIRKLAINLVDVLVFCDGPVTSQMEITAKQFGAQAISFPQELHGKSHGASDRNTAVVNWALRTRAKQYLSNGTAILLLDGDVFPLSTFDSVTLLNARRLVCRKHPAPWTRYCWIGFICLSPDILSTIDDFDVSQTSRSGRGYDSGGKTVEYLLKHSNASYAYMRETIFYEQDKSLFWGAVDVDVQWVHQHFSRCDKCGPEVFVSPFSDSNAVFYHMISATSEWRFGYQEDRLKAVFNSLMKSPYGPNSTISVSEMMQSVKKVQNMPKIPVFGNLTCERVCSGR